MLFQDFQARHHDGHIEKKNKKQKQFINFKSSCHPNASHQVGAQSDLQFGSRHGLKIFKRAIVEAILDIGTEQF